MDALDVATLTAWLSLAQTRLTERQGALNDLDAAIGDGDHGANLARGFAAVIAKLGTPADPATLFKTVAMTLIGTVGGASGPLLGSFFLAMSKEAGAAPTLDLAALRRVFAAGVAGIVARGKAARGEKTMIDALGPASDALEAPTGDLPTALAAAAHAAAEGAQVTAPLVARKGRASYLGERAVGHVDPGAASSAILLACLAEAARA